MAAGRKIARHWPQVVAHAFLYHNLHMQATFFENEPEKTPPGKCQQGIETASESGGLVVDVLLKWRFSGKGCLIVALYAYSQMVRNGNFSSECFLQLL